MGLILRNNAIIKNLVIGGTGGSGGGNGGGGGGSSEPSYLVVGAYVASTMAGTAYVYDASNYSTAATKLTPSGLSNYDFFGWSATSNGSQVAVGAKRHGGTGAVWVYDASNLSTTPTKLTVGSTSEFGGSLASSTSHIVVGSPATNSSTGAVYVYDATNLSASPTTLTPSGIASNDEFGCSVAASSDYIVVGVQGDDDEGNNAGAVYVYDATNLSATPTKLTPSSLNADDKFGSSVAVYGTQIVIGATESDTQIANGGAAYVYDATNLSAAPTVLAPTSLTGNGRSGNSVSVSSDYIVVGASGDNAGGSDAGAAYVYDASNLSAAPTKLTGGADDYFGHSVAVYGSQIVIGARRDDTKASNAGAVYVYDAANLSTSPTVLTASDGASGDEFGYSIGLG